MAVYERVNAECQDFQEGLITARSRSDQAVRAQDGREGSAESCPAEACGAALQVHRARMPGPCHVWERAHIHL